MARGVRKKITDSKLSKQKKPVVPMQINQIDDNGRKKSGLPTIRVIKKSNLSNLKAQLRHFTK